MTATAYTASSTTIKRYNEGITKEIDTFTWILPDNAKATDTITVPSITGYSAVLVSCVDSTTGSAILVSQTADKFTLGANLVASEANGSRIVMQFGYRKV